MLAEHKKENNFITFIWLRLQSINYSREGLAYIIRLKR